MRLVPQQASHSQLGGYLSRSLDNSPAAEIREDIRICRILIWILSSLSFLIDGTFIDFVALLWIFSRFCGLSLRVISSPLTASHFIRRVFVVFFLLTISRNRWSSSVVAFIYHSLLLTTLISLIVCFLAFRISLLSSQLRSLLAVFTQLRFKSLQLSFGRRNLMMNQSNLLKNQETVARLLRDVILLLSNDFPFSSTEVNSSGDLNKRECPSSLNQIKHYSEQLSSENLVNVTIQRLFSSSLTPFSSSPFFLDSEAHDVASGFMSIVEQTMFYVCNVFELFTSLITLYILMDRVTISVRNSFPATVKINTEMFFDTSNPIFCNITPLLSLKNSLKDKRLQLEKFSEQLKEMEFFLHEQETLLLASYSCSSSSGFNNFLSVDDDSKQFLLSELSRLSACFDLQKNLLLQDIVDVSSYQVIDRTYQRLLSDLLVFQKDEKLREVPTVALMTSEEIVGASGVSNSRCPRNTAVASERTEYEESNQEDSILNPYNNADIENIYNIYTGIANVDSNSSGFRCKHLTEERCSSQKMSNHLLFELKNVLQHQVSCSKQQVRIKEFDNSGNASVVVMKELSVEDLESFYGRHNYSSSGFPAGGQSSPVVSQETFFQMRSITTEFLSKVSNKSNEEIVLE
jgi:hypothetical protein